MTTYTQVLQPGDSLMVTVPPTVVVAPPPIVLPFPGFQKAHDQAMPGAVIAIPPGVYQEPAPVHSTKAGLIWQGATGVVLDASKMSVSPQAGAFYLAGPNQQWNGISIQKSPAAGLVVDGSGCSALDSELAFNGQEGYVFHQGFSWQGGAIHDNNPKWAPGVAVSKTSQPYDPGWEAGGGKATRCTGVVFDGVEVFRNGGPGLWNDIHADGLIIRNCRIHDQPFPLMFEISTRAQIVNNVLWEVGWGDGYTGGARDFWTAAILISSSGQAVVTGNLIAWCYQGVDFVSQARPQDSPPSTAGNSATGNLFALSTGRKQVVAHRDWADPAPLPVMSPNAIATAAQLAAAGVPAAPLPGH